MKKFWICAIFLFAGAVACSRSPQTNLLFITIDTWRWDYLGAAGSPYVKTPHLDALAKEGLLFTNTRAVAPLTMVSHASIFTGTYPMTHGVRDNGMFVLAPQNLTLAEILHAKGYQTGAVTGAFVVNSRYGLNQGFDTYMDVYAGQDSTSKQKTTPYYPEITADEVTRSEERRGGKECRSRGSPYH